MKRKIEQRESKDDVIVSIPKSLLNIAIICITVFVVTLSLVAILSSENSVDFYITLTLGYLILIPIVALKLFWKIIIRDDEIYVIDFLAKVFLDTIFAAWAPGRGGQNVPFFDRTIPGQFVDGLWISEIWLARSGSRRAISRLALSELLSGIRGEVFQENANRLPNFLRELFNLNFNDECLGGD